MPYMRVLTTEFTQTPVFNNEEYRAAITAVHASKSNPDMVEELIKARKVSIRSFFSSDGRFCTAVFLFTNIKTAEFFDTYIKDHPEDYAPYTELGWQRRIDTGILFAA